tara:strand:+ start:803 stop:1546 length:744 start_codon:yes stop_codon:yes gene_type:complete
MYMSPKERFITLFDNGKYSTIDYESPAQDPLNFKDTKKYTDRIKDAQKSTGQKEAILVSEGHLGGMNTIIACQDFKFMGGSMGMAVGNAILEGVKRAVKNKSPFILFAAAGGARMQESVLSLIQMPRTTVAIEMLRDAALPYIVVLTNPTTGGVTASYAMLGDVQIAEPNALICFAGPRVIEQTIREKLPEGFQRSEYLLDHGMLDKVVSRKFLREELIKLIYLLKNQPPPIRGNITEVDGSNGRDT